MTEAIVVTAVFTPAEGQFDAVYSALLPAIAASHEEEGCEIYALHKAPDGTLVMIEKWESLAHHEAHDEAAAVAALIAALDGLLAAPVVVTRLIPLPAGNEIQGSL